MTTKPLQGRKVGPQVLGRAEGEVGRWGGGGGGGEAVKCTEGGGAGGRASGTAELQRFTYPRVYRQLNEAQLGMQFLPLGHFLQRKCEVQPDRRGGRRKHRKRGTEEVRKKVERQSSGTRAEGTQLKEGVSASPVLLVSAVTMQTKQQVGVATLKVGPAGVRGHHFTIRSVRGLYTVSWT